MTIKPWREVAQPHKDVLEGTFKQSEFAADITQVHSGLATDEYQDPQKFFARTFITEGMRLLLRSVAERLSGRGGDPVIQLQTAFGGGKTHTLLAVYHLASRQCPTSKLSGIPPILDAACVAALPQARVAVIDGIKLAPSQPRSYKGLTVNSLWGELAFQLLGSDGFALVAEADRDGTSPGKEILSKLIQKAAPCVILLDELVAYIRQFDSGKHYSGGTYDSNMSFIQALTEAMKAVPNAILLASLPESETESGGAQGQRALAALEKYFGRVESVWKPVATEEAFEIVRRRLFDTVGDTETVRVSARAFCEMYRQNPNKFPAEAQDGRYEERIVNSYPIHPEVFDRLYEDWSTLDKFQRTRGVLQYVAILIHRLWNNNDKDPLIMPGSIPLDDAIVRNKSIHYLPTGWEPVIEREIDGPRSTPLDIDGHDTRFGSVQAARRVARTIFLGSAPSNSAQAVRGINVDGILLGCVQPGQSVGTYEDVIRRLRDQLHYLYGEKESYWFDTRPNLRREMESRKLNLSDADDVMPVLRERVSRVFASKHGFSGIHVFTASADVPDDWGLRLIVLSPKAAFRKQDDSLAVSAADEILKKRGESPRLKRNRLLFLAPDADAVPRLKDTVRTYLAWQSIIEDAQSHRLNLTLAEVEQTKRTVNIALESVGQMVRETYRWLLGPAEELRRGKPEQRWESLSVATSAPNLIQAIENKLREEEWVIWQWSPIHLARVLNQWYFKDGTDNVSALKVWQDSCQYLYLPRLVDLSIFKGAIAAGCETRDAFGYALAYENGRYPGFAFGRPTLVTSDQDSVLISKVEAERYQLILDAEEKPKPGPGPRPNPKPGPSPGPDPVPKPELSNRYFGIVELDPVSATLDFSKVANEVIQHFAAQSGTRVTVSVEIEADSDSGFDSSLKRTIRENSGVLKFKNSEFSKE